MKRGTATALAVVEGATQHLTEVGHAHFSMRGVADRIGISPGNLTYHFPTKTALLHAVVDHVVTLYTTWLETASTAESNPKTRLQGVVRYLVETSADPETAGLFRELWAMALHDAKTASSLRRVYEEGFETVGALLREINPKLTPDQVKIATTLIGLGSEGSCILSSERYDFVAKPRQVAKAITESVLLLIR